MGMRRINGTSGGYSVVISFSQSQHCVELVQVWVENEDISALQAGSKNPLPLIVDILNKLVPSSLHKDLGWGMVLGMRAVGLFWCQR